MLSAQLYSFWDVVLVCTYLFLNWGLPCRPVFGFWTDIIRTALMMDKPYCGYKHASIDNFFHSSLIEYTYNYFSYKSIVYGAGSEGSCFHYVWWCKMYCRSQNILPVFIWTKTFSTDLIWTAFYLDAKVSSVQIQNRVRPNKVLKYVNVLELLT